MTREACLGHFDVYPAVSILHDMLQYVKKSVFMGQLRGKLSYCSARARTRAIEMGNTNRTDCWRPIESILALEAHAFYGHRSCLTQNMSLDIRLR